jgi:trehalose 2-sulfotransferase
MKNYLVCATQRSGSTLLCELLGATGIAGRPAELYEALRHSGIPRQPREFFDPAHVPTDLPERTDEPHPLWDRDDYQPYFEWSLQQGRTPNGLFGAKLMWNYLPDFLALLGTVPRLAGLDGVPLLQAAFDDPVFVWVRRPNAVAQAVSLWKALQTAAWRDSTEPATEPRYDFDGLQRLVGHLREADEGWRRFFVAGGVEPVEVVYRDLAKDRRGTVGRVLEAIGLPAVLAPRDEPLERQFDDRSARWADRFRQEVQHKEHNIDWL